MTTWVVPCHYDPIVFECVTSIRDHFPGDRIILVDSNSPDDGYLKHIDVDRVLRHNGHYATNAWAKALDAEPDTERWALIHDSLLVNASWPQTAPVQTVRWFVEHTGHDAAMADFIQTHADRMGIPCPPSYLGVFGPMLFCSGEVLHELDHLGLFKALPIDKVQASGMERLTGLALTHLGYDVTNSLQGRMVDFHGHYDPTHVQKIYKDRQ